MGLITYSIIMVIKNMVLLIWICFALITIQSCGKLGEDCASTRYNFEVGFEVYPNKDAVKTGDTTWFELNTSATSKDLNTGNMIDYSGAENLGSDFAFQEVTSATTALDAAAGFDVIVLKGSQASHPKPALYRHFLFAEENGRYLFKVGVIAKRKGLFRIMLSNAANVFTRNNPCTKARYEVNIVNTNKHFYLHPGYDGNNTEKGGAYYFQVD